MSRAAPCKGCAGTGWQLFMNSWFVDDGLRKERCHICDGSKINPPGYGGWPNDAQRRFRARAQEWGGLNPPKSGRAHSKTPPDIDPQDQDGRVR